MALTVHKALRDLVCYLPFSLFDVRKANQVYGRWLEEGRPEDKKTVDLWTYCFIHNYFLFKFLEQPARFAADLDALVEYTLRRVEERRIQLNEVDKYAGWICVVCKNTFYNYLRSVHRMEYLEEQAVSASLETSRTSPDLLVAFVEIKNAIKRLPPFLREIAWLYFLENCSYCEIRERTGKSLPVIRSYVHKVVLKFRKDLCLRPYIEELAERTLEKQPVHRSTGSAPLTSLVQQWVD